MTRLSRLALVLLALALVLVPTAAWAQVAVDGDAGAAAIITSNQRATFYAGERFWVFYHDTVSGKLEFRSSSDLAATWSAATQIRDVASRSFFSIAYDGTYVHYVVDCGAGNNLVYRMGAPKTDGTITWSAAEQTVITGTTHSHPNLAVDSNGYPWVVYKTGSEDIEARKSSTKDGTWTTEGGFPDVVFAAVNPYSCDYPSIAPLTSGRMVVMAVWSNDAVQNVYIRSWSGAVWNTTKSTASKADNQNQWHHSFVTEDDDAHIVFLDINGNIRYCVYSYSTNSVSAETTLAATGCTASWACHATVISRDTGTNDLYVFWLEYPTAEHGYYRKYTNDTGTWETAVDWFTDTNTIQYKPYLSSTYESDNPNYIGLIWYSAGGLISFKRLESPLEVSTLAPTAVTTTSATLRGELTQMGASVVTTRGFEYRLSGGSTTTVSEVGEFGVGVFNSDIDGLESDTIYECRALGTDGEGTEYGEWVSFLTAQPDYGSAEQDAAGSESFLPDIPEPPEGFYPETGTDPTFSGLPGADLFNSLSESAGLPVAFWWYLILAIGFTVVGLLTYGGTKEQFAVAAIAAAGLGFLASLGWIGWWMLACYVIVALGLKGVERNYGL